MASLNVEWKSPPPASNQVLNLSHPMLIKLMFAWSADNPGRGLNGSRRLTLVGAASDVIGKNGIAKLFPGTSVGYVTSGPTSLPIGQWTMAVSMRCGSAWAIDSNAMGYCEAPGDTTYDRQIRRGTGDGHWGAYLHDGAVKIVTTGRILSLFEHANIVATTNGTVFNVYVNGGAPGSLAVATSGYVSYTTPEFVIGYSSNANAVTETKLVLMTEKFWTPAMAQAWIDNPWQVFMPGKRTIFYDMTPAAGAFKAAWARGSNVIIQPGGRYAA